MASAKQKAIELLEEQRDQIHDMVILDTAWISATAELIIKYIGQNTNYYHSLSEWSRRPLTINEEFAKMKRFEIDRLLGYCIRHIETQGVKKSSRISVIYNLSDQAVITIFCLIATGSFFLGDFFAKNKVERDRVKQEMEIDSLRKVNHTLSDVIKTLKPVTLQKPAELKANQKKDTARSDNN